MNQYGSKWIELSFKVKCSPLGEKVADFLAIALQVFITLTRQA